jgi:hypothetical protein
MTAATPMAEYVDHVDAPHLQQRQRGDDPDDPANHATQQRVIAIRVLMHERLLRVVLHMEEPRQRTEYHDRHDSRAHQDRERQAADMHQRLIAVLHVERPHEP